MKFALKKGARTKLFEMLSLLMQHARIHMLCITVVRLYNRFITASEKSELFSRVTQYEKSVYHREMKMYEKRDCYMKVITVLI